MSRDLFVMCVIVFLADYDVFLRRTVLRAFLAFLGRAGLALVGLRLPAFAFFGLATTRTAFAGAQNLRSFFGFFTFFSLADFFSLANFFGLLDFFGLVGFLVLATFFAFLVRAGLVGFARFFFRRFIRLAVSRSCGSVALAIAEGT